MDKPPVVKKALAGERKIMLASVVGNGIDDMVAEVTVGDDVWASVVELGDDPDAAHLVLEVRSYEPDTWFRVNLDAAIEDLLKAKERLRRKP